MDLKWILIVLLVFFAAVAYYRDDLAALGGSQGTEESELESLNARTPTSNRGREASTKDWY